MRIVLQFAVMVLLLQATAGGRDFYKILGVPRNADDRQIKCVSNADLVETLNLAPLG